MQHTPGPWEVYGGPKELLIHRDRKTIATVPRFRGETLEELKTLEVDARLIAAAPELLEALIELTKRTDRDGTFSDPTHENGKAHLKAISVIWKVTA